MTKDAMMKSDRPDPSQESGWVREMHKHYTATHSMRAGDLYRVLGDPRTCVEVKARTDSGHFVRKGTKA